MSPVISVHINGRAFALSAPATLADAVALLQLKPPFAAAVNLQFVPNTRYHHTPLSDADQIDLIAPVTGG
ncbi:sulfur carrier protein ThiS [Rhodoferax sp.]|uniref:sulfur carrier protein ThiS n=1 Tax=Rhodoferax sp. TaxID=50421 RepID=UPI0027345EC6|nr:sulfur carrier protein ThiS [Rhodoferax sp.]MDP3190335.1 sulfur carrier protein ThiS [Rhodoferax sp.]